MVSPARAADEDLQSWTAATATIDVNKKVVVWLEGQLRMTDNAARAGQILLRPGIGFKLDKTTTAMLGYAYVRTDPIGPALMNEHRIWQQLAFRIAGDGKGVTLTARSRLEQRFIEGSSDMGLRMRQQIRVTFPLAGSVRGVVWTEPFVTFNTTSWGQRRGLDRWRNSVALAIPISKTVMIEPGYLNQWVFRPGRDGTHHIANLTIAARF